MTKKNQPTTKDLSKEINLSEEKIKELRDGTNTIELMRQLGIKSYKESEPDENGNYKVSISLKELSKRYGGSAEEMRENLKRLSHIKIKSNEEVDKGINTLIQIQEEDLAPDQATLIIRKDVVKELTTPLPFSLAEEED